MSNTEDTLHETMGYNLNYCQLCGKWLGPDDYDGICVDCDVEEDVSEGQEDTPQEALLWDAQRFVAALDLCKTVGMDKNEAMSLVVANVVKDYEAALATVTAERDALKAELIASLKEEIEQRNVAGMRTGAEVARLCQLTGRKEGQGETNGE